MRDSVVVALWLRCVIRSRCVVGVSVVCLVSHRRLCGTRWIRRLADAGITRGAAAASFDHGIIRPLVGVAAAGGRGLAGSSSVRWASSLDLDLDLDPEVVQDE